MLMVAADMVHNIYRLLLENKLVAAPLRDPEHALDSKLRLVDMAVGIGMVNINQLNLCGKSEQAQAYGHYSLVSMLLDSSSKTPQRRTSVDFAFTLLSRGESHV